MASFVPLVLCVLVSLVSVEGFSSGNETALRSAIFAGYDIGVRPDPVTDVVMTFLPTSLGEINIKDSTMQITGWWIMHWNDSRLAWNSASYDNIDETHVYQHEIWTPPVIVYNSVDNLSAIQEDTIPLRVSSTGTVHWSPPAILTVSCSTDITYFPFDTQTCPISVTTFGYTINELTVTPLGVDRSFYEKNGEWEMRETHTSTDPQAYSFVSFEFVFRRKPAYYGLNFVMPVLMCWLLSVLIFLLPAQCGEKMGYSLTVFLAFVVLITLLADRMPTTADHVSYLEVYIILVLGFCGFSVAYTIFNLAIFFRDESEPVPPWLQSFTISVRNMCRRSTHKVAELPQRADNLDNAAPTLSRKLSRKWAEEESAMTAESDDVKVTWHMAARELDAIVFKVYFASTALLSFILLSIIGFHY